MAGVGRRRAGQAGGRARAGARHRSLWRRQDAEQPDFAQARAACRARARSCGSANSKPRSSACAGRRSSLRGCIDDDDLADSRAGRMPRRAGVFRRVGNRAGVSGRSESSRRQRKRTRTLASAGRAAGESRSCAGADAHRHQPRDSGRGGRAHQLFASQHTAHGLSRAVYFNTDHAGAGRVDSEAVDAHESAPVRAVRRAAVALPRDDSRTAALRGDSAQQIAAAPRGCWPTPRASS